MADNPMFPVTERGTATTSHVAIDAGLRQFLINVYTYMASGLALTGVVAYVAAESGLYASLQAIPLLFWAVVLAPLALVLLLSFRIEKMSLGSAQAAFWGYAGLVGLSLSGIFLVYTGASVARTFFVTAATFSTMSLYGYTTGRDLTGIGSFLVMGLVGIIIASLVNVFLVSTQLQFAISLIGVIIFVGLTAYDTQRLKTIYLEGGDTVRLGKKAIMGALALYLDFLNLFVMLLQLSGQRRN